jgi:ABC-2 type transport system permease protein
VRNTFTIASKEFRSYLTSPMAYVVTCIFLALTGVLFAYYLSSNNYADTSLRGFTQYAWIPLLLFASVLTMRSLAEEKKLGTWELLLTSPVRDTEVVVGKFLGGMGILLGMLILTLYYPFLLIIFGDPDIGPIWTSYLGLVLLGGAAFSVGIFASSLTSNQIVAAVLSSAILFALWLVGTVIQSAPKAIQTVVGYISLSSHFSSFTIGIIDTRAIIYYLSIIVLFLYLSIRSLETGRWG